MGIVNVDDETFNRIKKISSETGIKNYKLVSMAFDAYDKKLSVSDIVTENKKVYDSLLKKFNELTEKHKQLSINYKAVCDKLQNIKKAME
jgi:galactitol-specific phosphotransferase system IIB component